MRDRLATDLTRRASLRMFDPTVPPRPVGSLLDAATPLRRERHRQRYGVAPL